MRGFMRVGFSKRGRSNAVLDGETLGARLLGRVGQLFDEIPHV